MALPHAILVSLCEQSGSGYELARRFDRSIGYFWAATMFMVAGLLYSPIRKFKITPAADPLAALCRLPTRLDP